MSRDAVKVRALRPHDTSEGWKFAGDEYERTAGEADKLAARGVVEIVKTPAKKRK